MQIRSITCFIDPSNPINDRTLRLAGEFLRIAKPVFVDAGYEVQSERLASLPFPSLLQSAGPSGLAKLAQQFEQAAAIAGYAYVSLGPAFPHQLEWYEAIPEALAATQNAFFAGSLTTSEGEISLAAIHGSAQVIQRASTISADGFTNMRFAALANVSPGCPFFPAAFHQGGNARFALATEAADLAVDAFSQANSLQEARQNLVMAMQTHGRSLADLAYQVEGRTGVQFGGIDLSLAPYPEQGRSLGTAMEHLGVPKLGVHGSLAAAAILAGTMDQAEFLRAGFCGLFLPVLEDATLAARVADGSLELMDLLLYSAVCGTGLDTIPLPGDTSVEELSSILLDVASLSSRLGKPLTARLMPIPRKFAGDPTHFDFAYFANSRVMPMRVAPLGRFLAGGEQFSLKPRPRR